MEELKMEIMTNPNHESVNAEYWLEAMRPVFEGKKVILAGDVIAGLIPRARMIRELGAQSTFMLATEGMGTGDAPTEEDGHWFALDAPHSDNIVEAIHAGQRLLANLPQHAKEALDWYDPKREAMVVGGFLHEQPSVAGRKSLAYRKPEWLALDDKTVIDSVWDKIGVTREPSEVVPVDKESILAAMQRIDKGDGVVWGSDSKEGINGGATGVRWVRSESDVDKALEYFQKHCDQLRVMPFLEGIPCSIHGMVFPDYVAAFRPVEMVVLRKPESSEFVYAGTSSFYDPAPADREDMRTTAKKVGNALRDMVNFRGVFTIDGVMTKDGFRPTELNPRYGAGVMPLLKGLTDFPLELLAQAVVSGSNSDFKPKELEELIINTADKQRGGGTWRAVQTHLPQIDKRPVKLTDSGWQWANDEEKNDGTVIVGPGTLGSFVRFTPDNTSIPIGESFAPYACDFWRFVDENLGSDIGKLDAAKPVRL
jgi:hypothetical protein